MKRKAFSFERKLFRQDIYKQEKYLLGYIDFRGYALFLPTQEFINLTNLHNLILMFGNVCMTNEEYRPLSLPNNGSER